MKLASSAQHSSAHDMSAQSRAERAQEKDIAAHIFTTSAVMLGLCLTIISVVHGPRNIDRIETVVDDIVAIDAMIFLVACFLSYAALRSRLLPRMKRLESVADSVFLLGMVGIGVACVLLAWTIL
jgi:multisubunit Na+/H+ antiporter MnhF subunit